MLSAIILVLSLGLLGQFFVSYCRSLIEVYSRVEISPNTRELAKIANREVSGDDFRRLVGLVELCPYPADDLAHLRAIRTYHAVLSALRPVVRLSPRFTAWANLEGAGCAYLVAVALDRRMSIRGSEVT